MNENVLEDIGLTNSEAKVYLALLELGSSHVAPIVNAAGIAYSKIYDLLEKLRQKGLVSMVIKGGVKYFEAAPAKRILDYIEEKEKNLHLQKEGILKLLPILEEKQKQSKEISEISSYKSMKGIETIFSEILKSLKKGEEYFVFGAIFGATEAQRIFLLNYHLKRIERRVKLKILFHRDAHSMAKAYEEMKLTEVKYLDPQLVGPAQTMVVKDSTFIILWTENPIAIRIDNKEITASYKKYFDYLWKGAEITNTFR